MALYGERVGLLAICTPDANTTTAAYELAQRIVRVTYSSPPSFGAGNRAIVFVECVLAVFMPGCSYCGARFGG